ncbi:unnamed protein product [Rotaria socialis]|uniref:Uncharacterized protein n=1 Tax=Rotaria socialis TaxID=392032 RepID=A0A818IMI6_9BILA|nr:unnamed protein product [Rotaria socialis]CAF4419248.1 unnamed protein product [Rotaria socialis]
MQFYTYPYFPTGYWPGETPSYSQAFANVPQSQTVSTTVDNSMNLMGRLIDKTKRTPAIRTITNEKPPQSIVPIRILELDAKIENRPTIIDEKNPAVLKYRTPHFRSTATILFPPLEDGAHWKIGWIQSCRRMDFLNSYGDCGYSSWEFPQLVSGQNPMISDSDGRNYPFYGSKSEVSELHGPCLDYQTIKVIMNDNFYPHITWDIPTSNERLLRLTNVKRHQSFYTWLVAMNVKTGSILVLKTISWQMNLEINVDPTQAQGSRAILISDPAPSQPEILKQNIRIPTCVLYPPNANSAQILVWHPGCRVGEISKQPEIVVPPRCLSVLHQNPYYDHYIRHKTHTSIQNKLNSGSSSSSSSPSSENKTNCSQSSTTKSYCRLIFPQVSTSKSSSVPGNRCCNDLKHMLDDHARLAQGVIVR